MAGTLTKQCSSCGANHELVIHPGNKPKALTDYEYLCPESGRTVPLAQVDSDWWKTVDAKPADAVMISVANRTVG